MKYITTNQQSIRRAELQDVEYLTLSGAVEAKQKGVGDYLKIVLNRKWLFMLPLFIILPMALIYVAMKQPVYRAVTSIIIEKADHQVVAIDEILKTEFSPDFYHTQYEIIKSRSVLGEVVDRFQLDKKPAEEDSPLMQAIDSARAFPRWVLSAAVSGIRSLLGSETSAQESQTSARIEGGPELDEDSPEVRRREAIEQLHEALQVAPRKKTQLVDIVLHGDDPVAVANHVNAVAEAYIQHNLRNKLTSSQKAIIWLQNEARTLGDKIQNTNSALQRFREGEKFVSPENVDETHQLESLRASYIQTNAERKVLNTRLQVLRRLAKQNINDMNLSISPLSDTQIQLFRQQYVKLQLEYSSMLKKYRRNHPLMIQKNSQIQSLKDSVLLEIQRAIDSMQAEHDILLIKEKITKKELELQKTKLIKLNDQMATYADLKQNLEVDQGLYLTLSKRLAETKLTEALETNNIKIVEPALVPLLPEGGNLAKLLLATMIALGLGGGLVFLAENLDNRFKSINEAEQDMNLPFLGVVPAHAVRHGVPITVRAPRDQASEAYRLLRTLIQSSSTPQTQVLMVTSAVQGEGKSTTATNLAISFAQLEQTVLIIDADLRRPKLHQHFMLDNDTGLLDILERDVPWEQVIQRSQLKNLKVLVTGGTPVNPAELLSSDRMKDLLAKLRQAFDVIIVDSSMALFMPDVAVLTPEMDGILLVHCPAKVDKSLVLDAKQYLDRVGANFVGMVFNNIKLKDQKYRYYGQTYIDDSAAAFQSHENAKNADTSLTESQDELVIDAEHNTLDPKERSS